MTRNRQKVETWPSTTAPVATFPHFLHSLLLQFPQTISSSCSHCPPILPLLPTPSMFPIPLTPLPLLFPLLIAPHFISVLNFLSSPLPYFSVSQFLTCPHCSQPLIFLLPHIPINSISFLLSLLLLPPCPLFLHAFYSLLIPPLFSLSLQPVSSLVTHSVLWVTQLAFVYNPTSTPDSYV